MVATLSPGLATVNLKASSQFSKLELRGLHCAIVRFLSRFDLHWCSIFLGRCDGDALIHSQVFSAFPLRPIASRGYFRR
jgi:hypothetical protein